MYVSNIYVESLNISFRFFSYFLDLVNNNLGSNMFYNILEHPSRYFCISDEITY